MTQDKQLQVIDIEAKPLSFNDRATALLTKAEYDEMQAYITKGGSELALSTANKFFELYITGSDVEEIHRLNQGFPKPAIQWSRIKYGWDKAKDSYISKMQSVVVEKVLKAQLEATSFYSDIIMATVKKHGDKIKRYLQTGDDKILDGVLKIDNIKEFVKVIEGLQKITGQDRNIRISKDENVSVNVQAVSANHPVGLNETDAAEILRIIADSKRKKENGNEKGS